MPETTNVASNSSNSNSSSAGETSAASESVRDVQRGDEALNDAMVAEAKLFTCSASEDAWTEMGIGVVSVVLTPADSATRETTVSTREESEEETEDRPPAAGDAVSARLVMVARDDAADVLLSTPVSLEDLYTVQDGTILVWTDPAIGREMACSFSSKRSCDTIYAQIEDYQRRARLRRESTALALSGDASTLLLPNAERWAVALPHLPDILDAATSKSKPFGLRVRDDAHYFASLVALYDDCRARQDTANEMLLCRITVALLQTPFNSEPRIIGQFVEDNVIDKCIDMVQVGLGRRDAASGFVGFAQRRASFRNPCELPASMLDRIHAIYSCYFLQDLLPLSFDDGDMLSGSLLSVILRRYKYDLIDDVCKSGALLQRIFARIPGDDDDATGRSGDGAAALCAEGKEAATARQDAPSVRDTVAFFQDMAKIIKNAMMPMEWKQGLFASLTSNGMLCYLNRVLRWALRRYKRQCGSSAALPCSSHDAPLVTPKAETPRASEAHADASSETCNGALPLLSVPATATKVSAAASSNASEHVLASGVVQLTCDTLYACLAFLPSAYEELLQESTEDAAGCTLSLLLECMTVLHRSAELQAVLELVQNGVNLGFLMLGTVPAAGPGSVAKSLALLRFWVEGNKSGTLRPPLFAVMLHTASLLRTAFADAQDRAAEPPCLSVLPTNDVVRLHYCARLLQSLVFRADTKLRDRVAELLSLSELLPGIAALLGQHTRRSLSSLQAAAVSLLDSLCNTTYNGRVLRLLLEQGAVLDAAVLRLLRGRDHHDNLLTAALTHLLLELGECVHREKADRGARLKRQAVHNFFTPLHGGEDEDDEDGDGEQGDEGRGAKGETGRTALVLGEGDSSGSATLRVGSSGQGAAGRQTSAHSTPSPRKVSALTYQDVLTQLMARHGDQLRMRYTSLGTKLQHALDETVTEAEQLEVESSSIASTYERPVSCASEYEAIAFDFPLDSRTSTASLLRSSMPPSPSSRTTSETGVAASRASANLSSPSVSRSASPSSSSSSEMDKEDDDEEREDDARAEAKEGSDGTTSSSSSSSTATAEDDHVEGGSAVLTAVDTRESGNDVAAAKAQRDDEAATTAAVPFNDAASTSTLQERYAVPSARTADGDMGASAPHDAVTAMAHEAQGHDESIGQKHAREDDIAQGTDKWPRVEEERHGDGRAS